VGGILPGFAVLVGRPIGRPRENLWKALILLDFALDGRRSSGQRDGFHAIPAAPNIMESSKCCYLKQQVSWVFRIINHE